MSMRDVGVILCEECVRNSYDTWKSSFLLALSESKEQVSQFSFKDY